jgi:S-(hydroxymethyl)glutathione dehydrogenase/alcohol dehydrogenase
VTTFSQRTVVSENRCVVLPDGIPLDVASLLGCAVLTGAGIVLNEMHAHAGSSIAIWGVGGIGLSAVMAATLSGCSMIAAVDVEPSKLQIAREFGATHLINSKQEDASEALRSLTHGKGVDFAVEAAGRTETIEKAFESVRKGGGLCVFAGHPPTGERIRIDPHSLISGMRIQGSWGGGALPDQDVPRFVEHYRKGQLPLEQLITHRYSLEHINHGFTELERGTVARALIDMKLH